MVRGCNIGDARLRCESFPLALELELTKPNVEFRIDTSKRFVAPWEVDTTELCDTPFFFFLVDGVEVTDPGPDTGGKTMEPVEEIGRGITPFTRTSDETPFEGALTTGRCADSVEEDEEGTCGGVWVVVPNKAAHTDDGPL